MCDYAEEQENELQALEAIYTNELKINSREVPIEFEITIETNSSKLDVENVITCLKFTLPFNYPEAVPEIEVSSEYLEEYQLELLQDFMTQIANENVGMVMTFIIVSSVQEKLLQMVEDEVERKREEEERKKKEAEEAEMKKFEGHKVTVESFLSWRTRFQKEMEELKENKIKEDLSNRKLTGRELFMKDHAMDDSDVKFLEEGGEVVEVDESLFQDLDDLSLAGGDEEEEREMQRKLIMAQDE